VQSWESLEGQVNGGRVLRLGETPTNEEEEVILEDDVSLQKAIEELNTGGRSHVGPFEFFDKEIYYNLDDTPKYQVFTFHKTSAGEMPTKQELLENMREINKQIGETVIAKQKYREEMQAKAKAGEEVNAFEFMIKDEEYSHKISELDLKWRGGNDYEAIWLTADSENPEFVHGGGLPFHFLITSNARKLIQDTQFQDYSFGRFYYENETKRYLGIFPPDYQLGGEKDDPPYYIRSHDSAIYSRENLESEKKEVLIKMGLWSRLLRFLHNLLPLF